MSMKELIEQIGGRQRLEELLSACEGFSEEERKTGGKADLQNWLDVVHPGNTELMARAILAVLDAQEKPAYFIRFDEDYGLEVSSINQFNGGGKGFPVWTTPAAASVPDVWKLVPVEPTKNMIAKIHPISHGTCHHCFATVNNDCEENVRLSWQDMVAAAPSPGVNNAAAC